MVISQKVAKSKTPWLSKVNCSSPVLCHPSWSLLAILFLGNEAFWYNKLLLKFRHRQLGLQFVDLLSIVVPLLQWSWRDDPSAGF